MSILINLDVHMLQLVNIRLTYIGRKRTKIWNWKANELPKAHWFVYGTLIWLMLKAQEGKKGEASWDEMVGRSHHTSDKTPSLKD